MKMMMSQMARKIEQLTNNNINNNNSNNNSNNNIHNSHPNNNGNVGGNMRNIRSQFQNLQMSTNNNNINTAEYEIKVNNQYPTNIHRANRNRLTMDQSLKLFQKTSTNAMLNTGSGAQIGFVANLSVTPPPPPSRNARNQIKRKLTYKQVICCCGLIFVFCNGGYMDKTNVNITKHVLRYHTTNTTMIIVNYYDTHYKLLKQDNWCNQELHRQLSIKRNLCRQTHQK
eukprot:133917_1